MDLNENLALDYEQSMEMVDFGMVERPIAYVHPTMDLTPPLHYRPIPQRKALVRTDTGTCLGVVSQNYKLVRHEELLRPIMNVVRRGSFGKVPAGVYVDKGGARMRALFKFQDMAQSFLGQTLCPAVRIRNALDGTQQYALEVGAFNFVCTNLSMGGGGIFLSGFHSRHTALLDPGAVEDAIGGVLMGFDRILGLFNIWNEQEFSKGEEIIPELVGKRAAKELIARTGVSVRGGKKNVYEAYGDLTDYATHQTKTANRAFECLGAINKRFQEEWPLTVEIPASQVEESIA